MKLWRWGAWIVGLAAGVAAQPVATVGSPDEPPRAVPGVRPGEPPSEELRRVTVTAEGYNRDDAVKQALRMALEQGAGTQLAGYSTVANYELIRDTIYSRAAGVVSEYRVLGERPGAGGTVEVTVEALVRPSAVAAAWGEVQNVLDQIGRPKIMVWIDERIDGQLAEQSVVESRIEELLVKAGFDLVAREGVEEARRREAAAAEAEQDTGKLVRLAKEAGAHILIRGRANADRAGIEDLYGVPAAFYNCDVQAKVYYTDTGRLLASESIPVTRRGVRSRHEYSPQAARAALVDATFPRSDRRREPTLAIRLYEAVMEQWATQITAGGDLTLEVEGLDFRGYVQLRKALEQIDRVRAVDGDFAKGTATYRFKAQLSAAVLAERLTEPPFDKLVEVTDLKLNRIQARAAGAAAAPAGPATAPASRPATESQPAAE